MIASQLRYSTHVAFISTPLVCALQCTASSTSSDGMAVQSISKIVGLVDT